ncbi:MAG: ABC transporter permease [Firmicutes bacterium]|jgi:ribose transport system permease protein|nr:ABC transporter permease [Bacillota bacterium]MDD4793455.1 ABC transporter permease [Bacillota bacterium]
MEKTRNFDYKAFIEKYGALGILVLCMIVLSIISPYFLTGLNLKTIAIQTAVIAIIAIGQTFVIITGGIDLSVGANLALSNILAASMMTSGVPLWICIITSLAFSTAFGYINGLAVTKMKVPPFIVTLGTMSISRGIALVITNGTPISRLPEALSWFGRGEIVGMPVPVLIFIVGAIIFNWVLNHTLLGRYTYAVGSNMEATRLSGINTDKTIRMVYILSGFLAGLAGIVLMGRLGLAHPTAGADYNMNSVAAAVIGGTSMTGGIGNIFGTMIGALIMGVLNNGFVLLGLSSFYQEIAIGVVVIMAVYLDLLQHRKLR